MLTEAVILAVLALVQTELEFLCTPAGQRLAMNVEERIKTLQARADAWIARLEARTGVPAKAA